MSDTTPSVWVRQGDRLYRYPTDAEYAVGVLMYLRADGLATGTPTEVQLGPAVPAPPPPPSLALEPTEEQRAVLEAFLYPRETRGVTFGIGSPMEATVREHVDETWRLIAPMALEAAAQACDVVAAEGIDQWWREAEYCAAAIRALKGTP
jgi:hypothetical protein